MKGRDGGSYSSRNGLSMFPAVFLDGLISYLLIFAFCLCSFWSGVLIFTRAFPFGAACAMSGAPGNAASRRAPTRVTRHHPRSDLFELVRGSNAWRVSHAPRIAERVPTYPHPSATGLS